MERLTWRPPFALLGPPAFLDQFAVDSPPGSFVCSQPRQHVDGANTAEVVLLVSNEAMVPEGRRRDWTACIERQRATQHRVEARRAAGCVDSGHGTSRFVAPSSRVVPNPWRRGEKKALDRLFPAGPPGLGSLVAAGVSSPPCPCVPGGHLAGRILKKQTRLMSC